MPPRSIPAAAGLSRRTFLRAAGVTAFAATGASALAACSSSSPTTTSLVESKLYPSADAQKLNDSFDWGKSAVADPKSSVTITVAHSWSPADFVRQQQFDYFFQKRHPNIKIVAENAGDSSADYLKKYSSQAAGGSLPDVMYNGFGFAQNFIGSGAFLALNDYISGEPNFNPSDFTEVSTGYYKRDGKQYSVPYDCGPVMIYYNKNIFTKAGVELPTAKWKFDDLRNAVLATTSGQGGSKIFGLSLPVTPADTFWDPVRLSPLGGHYLSDDESQVLLDQPESIAAVQWWMDMYLQKGVFPSPSELQGLSQADAFTLGRAAIKVDGSWGAPALREQANFEWGIADWPAGPKGHSTAAVGSAYSITSKSANKDAAWIYLNEYLSTSGQVFMFASTGKGNMTRKSAWPAYLKSEAAPEGADAIYNALNTYATSKGVVFGPATPQITNAVTPIWDQVMGKSLGVSDACKKIAATIQPLLKKNVAG